MREKVKIARNTIARRACVFNFLPLFTSRCFLAGLTRKLKEKFLCDLPPGRRPYGSYGPEDATRAKRAVNQCINDNIILTITQNRSQNFRGNVLFRLFSLFHRLFEFHEKLVLLFPIRSKMLVEEAAEFIK